MTVNKLGVKSLMFLVASVLFGIAALVYDQRESDFMTFFSAAGWLVTLGYSAYLVKRMQDKSTEELSK